MAQCMAHSPAQCLTEPKKSGTDAAATDAEHGTPRDDDLGSPSPAGTSGAADSTATTSPSADGSRTTRGGAPPGATETSPRLTGTLLMETEPDTPAMEPQSGADRSLDHQPGLRVALLGRPSVTGWTTQPKGNRADEIIVYLAAVIPDPVHRDRLMEALWNGGRVKPKALFNHIAAIRRHADDPEIIVTDNATYRLAESVRSDWDNFRALTDSASDLGGAPALVEHAWREAVRVAGDDELPLEVSHAFEAARLGRARD